MFLSLQAKYLSWLSQRQSQGDSYAEAEFGELVAECKNDKSLAADFAKSKMLVDPANNVDSISRLCRAVGIDIKNSSGQERFTGVPDIFGSFCYGSSPERSKVSVVGICGNMETGKSHVSNAMCDAMKLDGQEVHKVAFADELKRFCIKYFNSDERGACVSQSDKRKSTAMCAVGKFAVFPMAYQWHDMGRIVIPPWPRIMDFFPHLRTKEAELLHGYIKLGLTKLLMPDYCADKDEEDVAEFGLISTRKILQVVATCFKDVCGENFWIEQLQSKIQTTLASDLTRGDIRTRISFVIEDVRFPNEGAWINACGGVVIKIVDPTWRSIRIMDDESKHVSEKSVSDVNCAVEYENNPAKSVDTLYEFLEDVLRWQITNPEAFSWENHGF